MKTVLLFWLGVAASQGPSAGGWRAALTGSHLTQPVSVAPDNAGLRGEAFWRAIVKNGFEPPAGTSVADLAHELNGLLASPDPELRDELGYSILASWIYQKRLLGPDALRPLMAEWIANLGVHADGKDADSVFRRSFSALVLSVVVARDNADPFLEKQEFRQLLRCALDYLESEQDLRGYDPQLGWIHATAHTADLLKFLCRSRFFTPADEAPFLNAISNKLEKASVVFINGEDERLARAALSLVMRKDFDLEAFRIWAAGLRPVPPASPRPKETTLRAQQNLKNFFAKLELVLLSQGDGLPNLSAAAETLRATLKGTF